MRRLCEIDLDETISSEGTPIGEVISEGVKPLQQFLCCILEQLEELYDPLMYPGLIDCRDLHLFLEAAMNLADDLEDCLARIDSELVDLILGKRKLSPEQLERIRGIFERNQAELGKVSPAAAQACGPAIFSPEMSRQIQKLREADLGDVDID